MNIIKTFIATSLAILAAVAVVGAYLAYEANEASIARAQAENRKFVNQQFEHLRIKVDDELENLRWRADGLLIDSQRRADLIKHLEGDKDLTDWQRTKLAVIKEADRVAAEKKTSYP